MSPSLRTLPWRKLLLGGLAAALAVTLGAGVGVWLWADDWLVAALERAAADQLGAELQLGSAELAPGGLAVHGLHFSVQGEGTALQVDAPEAWLGLDVSRLRAPRVDTVWLPQAEITLQLPATVVPSLSELVLAALGRGELAAQQAWLPAPLQTHGGIDRVAVEGRAELIIGALQLPLEQLSYQAEDVVPSSVSAVLMDCHLSAKLLGAHLVYDSYDDPQLRLQDVDLALWDSTLRHDRWLSLDAGTLQLDVRSAGVALDVRGLVLGVSARAPVPLRLATKPLQRWISSQGGDLSLTLSVERAWNDPVGVLVAVWTQAWSRLTLMARRWVMSALRDWLP